MGDCYLLATLCALDARPGALEDLFYTKQINEAGIYAMHININGKKTIVHVDDRIPVKKIYRFGRRDYFPPYANSKIEGEIWPMIAEKIWAKLTGSYANAESGASSWVLKHFTNDPAKQYYPLTLPDDNIWTKL